MILLVTSSDLENSKLLCWRLAYPICSWLASIRNTLLAVFVADDSRSTEGSVQCQTWGYVWFFLTVFTQQPRNFQEFQLMFEKNDTREWCTKQIRIFSSKQIDMGDHTLVFELRSPCHFSLVTAMRQKTSQESNGLIAVFGTSRSVSLATIADTNSHKGHNTLGNLIPEIKINLLCWLKRVSNKNRWFNYACYWREWPSTANIQSRLLNRWITEPDELNVVRRRCTVEDAARELVQYFLTIKYDFYLLGGISNLTNSKRNLWSEWQTVFLFFAHRLWSRRQRANY